MNGSPVESGEESAAIPLAAGATTALTARVTAEDGTARTYTVNVSRGSRPAEVSVVAGEFTLDCPATVGEGESLSCTLKNGSSEYAEWPVVAIIHSSADSGRALIAEDSVIADTDPGYSQDLKFASAQTHPMDNYNYGYGELFSGGSRSVYTTYGYQKFDWTGRAAAEAERTVSIEIAADQLSESDEVFYVALAPSGYTGLSNLVDNKAPVLIQE